MASSRPRALHIQNEVTDPAVPFVEALVARGFEVETVHPYDGGQLPDSLEGIAAVVAGGGLVDTHQAGEHRWLAHEISLVAEAIETATPYIGLCLGAQVLTEAAGGQVYRCDPHEVGWHEVELLPAAGDDPLFGGLPPRFTTMQWHYYACRPGDAAVELATNPVALQALRVGECAWGTQFHIEATREVLLGWLEMGGDDLRANGYPPEVYTRSLEENYDQHSAVGRMLAARFAQLADEKRVTRSTG
jgi:GMP synthase-like glutamine amidotransferase